MTESDKKLPQKPARRPYTPPKLVRYGGLSQPVLGGDIGAKADGNLVKGQAGKT